MPRGGPRGAMRGVAPRGGPVRGTARGGPSGRGGLPSAPARGGSAPRSRPPAAGAPRMLPSAAMSHQQVTSGSQAKPDAYEEYVCYLFLFILIVAFSRVGVKCVKPFFPPIFFCHSHHTTTPTQRCPTRDMTITTANKRLQRKLGRIISFIYFILNTAKSILLIMSMYS